MVSQILSAYYFLSNKLKRFVFDDKAHQSRLVNSSTLLTIEGFPRSGNSYMCKLVKVGNPSIRYKIANHMHHPMNIIASVENSIKTVCMIREPRDVIIANVAHILYVNKTCLSSGSILNQSPVPLFEDLLNHYLWYYNSLSMYSNKILFIPLVNLINNEEQVVERINAFHHLNLAYAKIDPSKVKSHMLPNVERGKIKDEVAPMFDKCEPAGLQKANDFYAKLTDSSISLI